MMELTNSPENIPDSDLSTVMARMVRTEVWDTVSSMKGTSRHIAFPITQMSWHDLSLSSDSFGESSHLSHVHLDHGVGAAHDEDEEVGDAEVEEEEVGGGPHWLGGEDDDEDEDIPHHAHGQHETEEDEAGVGDVGGEDGLLGVDGQAGVLEVGLILPW